MDERIQYKIILKMECVTHNEWKKYSDEAKNMVKDDDYTWGKVGKSR